MASTSLAARRMGATSTAEEEVTTASSSLSKGASSSLSKSEDVTSTAVNRRRPRGMTEDGTTTRFSSLFKELLADATSKGRIEQYYNIVEAPKGHKVPTLLVFVGDHIRYVLSCLM
jgi:hypothetical protein